MAKLGEVSLCVLLLLMVIHFKTLNAGVIRTNTTHSPDVNSIKYPSQKPSTSTAKPKPAPTTSASISATTLATSAPTVTKSSQTLPNDKKIEEEFGFELIKNRPDTNARNGGAPRAPPTHPSNQEKNETKKTEPTRTTEKTEDPVQQAQNRFLEAAADLKARKAEKVKNDTNNIRNEEAYDILLKLEKYVQNKRKKITAMSEQKAAEAASHNSAFSDDENFEEDEKYEDYDSYPKLTQHHIIKRFIRNQHLTLSKLQQMLQRMKHQREKMENAELERIAAQKAKEAEVIKQKEAEEQRKEAEARKEKEAYEKMLEDKLKMENVEDVIKGEDNFFESDGLLEDSFDGTGYKTTQEERGEVKEKDCSKCLQHRLVKRLTTRQIGEPNNLDGITVETPENSNDEGIDQMKEKEVDSVTGNVAINEEPMELAERNGQNIEDSDSEESAGLNGEEKMDTGEGMFEDNDIEEKNTADENDLSGEDTESDDSVHSEEEGEIGTETGNANGHEQEEADINNRISPSNTDAEKSNFPNSYGDENVNSADGGEKIESVNEPGSSEEIEKSKNQGDENIGSYETVDSDTETEDTYQEREDEHDEGGPMVQTEIAENDSVYSTDKQESDSEDGNNNEEASEDAGLDEENKSNGDGNAENDLNEGTDEDDRESMNVGNIKSDIDIDRGSSSNYDGKENSDTKKDVANRVADNIEGWGSLETPNPGAVNPTTIRESETEEIDIDANGHVHANVNNRNDENEEDNGRREENKQLRDAKYQNDKSHKFKPTDPPSIYKLVEDEQEEELRRGLNPDVNRIVEDIEEKQLTGRERNLNGRSKRTHKHRAHRFKPTDPPVIYKLIEDEQKAEQQRGINPDLNRITEDIEDREIDQEGTRNERFRRDNDKQLTLSTSHEFKSTDPPLIYHLVEDQQEAEQRKGIHRDLNTIFKDLEDVREIDEEGTRNERFRRDNNKHLTRFHEFKPTDPPLIYKLIEDAQEAERQKGFNPDLNSITGEVERNQERTEEVRFRRTTDQQSKKHEALKKLSHNYKTINPNGDSEVERYALPLKEIKSSGEETAVIGVDEDNDEKDNEPVGPIKVKEEMEKLGKGLPTNSKDSVRWREPVLNTNCWYQTMTAMQNSFRPSCNSDGTYGPKQCYKQRCWCVDQTGKPHEKKSKLRFFYSVKGLMLKCTQNGL